MPFDFRNKTVFNFNLGHRGKKTIFKLIQEDCLTNLSIGYNNKIALNWYTVRNTYANSIDTLVEND